MSLTVVMLLYTLMITVTVGVIPAGQLSGSLTPIAQAARIFAGPTGFALLSGAAILAFISTVNAGLLAASRYPYALAADELLPPRFKVLSKRYRTPGFSILVTSGIIGVSFLLNLEVLVRAASAVVLMSSLLTHVSVIVLRESRVQNYRPSFRSPLYPGIQAAGILVYAFLLADMGLLALGVSAGLIGLGVLFYLLYGRARASAEFALMHLVERVTDRSLTAHGLEAELRDIIRHRDELPFDRFDRLVEGAVVLDLQTCAGPDELFHLVSGDLSGRTGLKPDELHRLLVDREAESSTAISPFVAVPHLVLPGTGEFQLCMVRCRDGVYFSEEAPSVKAMFFLAGTRDERTFHLQALAALAQIIQNEGFEEQWMNARGESNLRDLLLLGTRRRMEQSPR
jgi:mannitol/fructose-specific phosphotransferase system IIA component (Ntr-type)